VGGESQQNAAGEVRVLILVDTSVWIEFFKGRNTPEALYISQAIENEDDLCTCGPILQEVLQGIRTDADHSKTKEYLLSLVYLPVGKALYLDAADIYRRARRRGETLRKPIDCVIAACAIRQSALLLERDNDFDAIARYAPLKLCL
jgi:predicted nucleic acid-binding protein